MYEMTTREQSPLALRREVKQELARRFESMQYKAELAGEAQDVLSAIAVTAQRKLMETDYISLLMLEGAKLHGCLLPDTEETILTMRQQYQQFADYAYARAAEGILVDLQGAI